MKFVIIHNNKAVTFADYPDEARDFAERMYIRAVGFVPVIAWTHSGRMVVDGVSTGWVVGKVKIEAEDLVPA